jgi:hypothetical protein
MAIILIQTLREIIYPTGQSFIALLLEYFDQQNKENQQIQNNNNTFWLFGLMFVSLDSILAWYNFFVGSNTRFKHEIV